MTVSPCSDSGGSVCTRLRLLFLHGMFFTGTLSVNSMAWPAVHAAAWTPRSYLVCGSLSAGLNRYERTCEDGRGQAVVSPQVNPA